VPEPKVPAASAAIDTPDVIPVLPLPDLSVHELEEKLVISYHA
jgi:hypothetical protein